MPYGQAGHPEWTRRSGAGRFGATPPQRCGVKGPPVRTRNAALEIAVNIMKKSTKIPDPDQTARKRQEDESERIPAAADLYSGGNNPDTSNKSGRHSPARKLAASRPEFGSSPGAKHVDGATG